LTDGPSDDALMPILRWSIIEAGVRGGVQGVWADLCWLRRRPRGLVERITAALRYYPCDLLFVHRDAEGRDLLDARSGEIRQALDRVAIAKPPVVCVVPVRMTEAWLLLDEGAIRRAAGNPNGREPLALPRPAEIEALPDPKETLAALLRDACGLGARRRRRKAVRVSLVAGHVEDFTPLRSLSAFRTMEKELEAIIHTAGWDT
jgi:hypothetical protein